MKRLLCLIFAIATCFTFYGQTNSKVKEMETQRNKIEQEIAESKRLLSSTQKDVDGQLAQLSALTAQIKKQKQFVARLDNDVKALDRELKNIEEQLVTLQAELDRRREHYAYALRLMTHNNTFGLCFCSRPNHSIKWYAACVTYANIRRSNKDRAKNC